MGELTFVFVFFPPVHSVVRLVNIRLVQVLEMEEADNGLISHNPV